MEAAAKRQAGCLYGRGPQFLVWHKALRIRSAEKIREEPGRRLFRVVTGDGGLFELCYNETIDRWSAIEPVPF